MLTEQVDKQQPWVLPAKKAEFWKGIWVPGTGSMECVMEMLGPSGAGGEGQQHQLLTDPFAIIALRQSLLENGGYFPQNILLETKLFFHNIFSGKF